MEPERRLRPRWSSVERVVAWTSRRKAVGEKVLEDIRYLLPVVDQFGVM